MNTLPYPSWIYCQSAVLPYRLRGGDLEVLLISSRGGRRWVVPKGIIEPGMTARASATKEALEEAGVQGDAAREPLGSYRYDKWGGTCEVAVFPYRVHVELDEWPESGLRRRRWLSLAKAMRRVEVKGLRTLMARLPAALDGDHDIEPAPSAAPEPGPARLLLVFRHAKSSWTDPDLDDFDRPLAPRGERACAAMRRYMRVADIQPDLVLCSAAVRAVQTLERVMPALGEGVEVTYHRGLYLAGPQAILNRVRRSGGDRRRVMLVGHNPGLHTLALRLAGCGADADLARLRTNLPTGALATLVFRGESWDALGPGRCALHSLVLPREIGKPRVKPRR